MTTLTAAQIESMTAKELRPIAQELKLPGAWKATREQLVQMLLPVAQPEVDQVTKVDPEVTEVTSDVWATTEEPTEIWEPTISTPNTPKELLLLNPSPTAEPTEVKAKAAKKAPKTYTQLVALTSDQVDQITAATVVTASSCSDPGRLVVARKLIRQFVEDVHGVALSEKVFNQLVVLASRSLPRQQLTIQSASRFKYLLGETHPGQSFPPAILVADWVLAHPESYKQAAVNYQISAETGAESTTRTW